MKTRAPALSISSIQDTRKKFLSMSRNVAVAIRDSGSTGVHGHNAKLALAMLPGASALLESNLGTTVSALTGNDASIIEDAVETKAEAAVAFPVHLAFYEGDSHGMERAAHNADEGRVKREGFQPVTHVCPVVTHSLTSP